MKKILLWDQRFPARDPLRLSVDDTIASAIVRSGVGAAADPAESGALSIGAPLDPTAPTEVVLQHGSGRTVRTFLPFSVVLVGAAAGVLAAIGKPIAATVPNNPIITAPPTPPPITGSGATWLDASSWNDTNFWSEVA